MPFDVTSSCRCPAVRDPERLQRTRGTARIGFRVRDGGTRLDRLYQEGAAKVRFPKGPRGEPPQAVLINTAGGLTGGDAFRTDVDLGPSCRAVMTTQACEKIYRARDTQDARITTRLTVGEGARLDWLPQEAILFDRGRASRLLEADLAAGARLLAVEASIFGRTAMGEVVTGGSFRDRWRIRREGRLVFADDLHLDWAFAGLLGRPAVLGGAGAVATLAYLGDDAERFVDPLRAVVGDAGGASAWDGKLLARIVAHDGMALRGRLVPALLLLLDGLQLPKVWQI